MLFDSPYGHPFYGMRGHDYHKTAHPSQLLRRSARRAPAQAAAADAVTLALSVGASFQLQVLLSDLA